MISSSRTTARTSILAALLLALSVAVFARPAGAREWPAPRGHLSDFAGVVDTASADSIEALCAELREKTGAELAVVTLPDLGGETIDPVAVELFEQWGIGKKGKDDGVLIVLGRAERRVRIEVGYGLEGILPDGRCGAIIRRVMGPDLHADRFGPGLLRGAEAVANVIAQDRGVTLERRGRGEAPAADADEESSGVALLVFFLLGIIIPIFVAVAIARERRRKRGGGWGTWGSGRRRGMHDPWGGFGGGLGGLGGFGGGGGGGGGGGFGGFGGGGSGGGGASGGF